MFYEPQHTSTSTSTSQFGCLCYHQITSSEINLLFACLAGCIHPRDVQQGADEWIVVPRKSGVQDGGRRQSWSQLVVHGVPGCLAIAVHEATHSALQAGGCHCPEVVRSTHSLAANAKLPDKQLDRVILLPLSQLRHLVTNSLLVALDHFRVLAVVQRHGTRKPVPVDRCSITVRNSLITLLYLSH